MSTEPMIVEEEYIEDTNDIYCEAGLEERSDADEISSAEEGFMQGYLQR